MTKIAIIGKPNVGKSSLFNRLASKRIAITSDFSGTTRDINDTEVLIDDKPCIILDTGGLDDSSIMFKEVKKKSLKAADMADVILYMVDAKFPPSDEDKQIFFSLQKLEKPIALVINKVDSHNDEERAWGFDSFGAKNSFNISVSHNKGVIDLGKWISRYIKDTTNKNIPEIEDDFSFEDLLKVENETKPKEESNEIKVAIIGRVNVGKSSLLNALLNEDKAVVSPTAGTTIDPIDESMMYEDKKITFVDTAGIRKRGKIVGIEKFALNRTENMLDSADIALLVLDASQDFKELDERIASLVEKFRLGVIIVLNKWDENRDTYKNVVADVRYRFKFLAHAPVMTVSALTRQRVHRIMDKLLVVSKNYSTRIPTGKLNDFIKLTTNKHHIPSDHGKTIKIYFATQYDTRPPRLALVMNKAKLHFSYKRYLINSLRDQFDFEGVPILIKTKDKNDQAEKEFEDFKKIKQNKK